MHHLLSLWLAHILFPFLQQNLLTYSQVHEKYHAGVGELEEKERLMAFGENKIDVPLPSILTLLLNEVLTPFYIFQMFRWPFQRGNETIFIEHPSLTPALAWRCGSWRLIVFTLTRYLSHHLPLPYGSFMKLGFSLSLFLSRIPAQQDIFCSLDFFVTISSVPISCVFASWLVEMMMLVWFSLSFLLSFSLCLFLFVSLLDTHAVEHLLSLMFFTEVMVLEVKEKGPVWRSSRIIDLVPGHSHLSLFTHSHLQIFIIVNILLFGRLKDSFRKSCWNNRWNGGVLWYGSFKWPLRCEWEHADR